MEFAWTPEQEALRAHARAIAVDAVERYGRFNDSWMNGYSKEFSKELGALGFIGMTWPKEFGGGGRPPIDRLIVGEELIAAGAPIAASWFGDRQMAQRSWPTEHPNNKKLSFLASCRAKTPGALA